jgi:DNA replication protein DnaC
MNSTESKKDEPRCRVCNDVGTLHTTRWVEDESYTYNGKPMPVQVSTVELCECQREAVFNKYSAAAGMKPNERQRTFDSSMIDAENDRAFTQVRKFIENIDHHLVNGSWLYIYGDEERAKKESKSAYGTGKSHLTHCAGNLLTAMKKKAIYVTEDKLFEEIKATYSRDADETESEVIYRYENVPILLIDDLFKSKTTDWTEDKLFHLLNNRQQPGRVTIINSNYAPNRISLTLPKNGPAIASRVLEQAVLVEMVGTDRRRKKAIDRHREVHDTA